MTTWGLVLRILAVARMTMVTGEGPQRKVMMPPLATARTTAAEVQPAGVPLPITWSGSDVSTARAAAGTNAWPAGLPGAFCRATARSARAGPAVAPRCVGGEVAAGEFLVALRCAAGEITKDAPHPAIKKLEMHAAAPRSRMAPHASPAATPRRFIPGHPLRAALGRGPL